MLWTPFELSFGAINTRFLNHVEVVIRTAGIEEHQRLLSKETLEAQDKEGKPILDSSKEFAAAKIGNRPRERESSIMAISA